MQIDSASASNSCDLIDMKFIVNLQRVKRDRMAFDMHATSNNLNNCFTKKKKTFSSFLLVIPVIPTVWIMGRQYNQEHRSTFVPGWGFPTSFNYKTSASQKSKISTENPPRSTYSQKNNSLNNDQPSPRTSSSTASDNTLDKAFASDSERRAS